MSVSDVRNGVLYVPRQGDGAAAVDALLEAGLDRPVAIFGPAGSGKSTELAALAQRREPKWVGPLVRLDKQLPYRDDTSADDVLSTIAAFAIQLAVEKLHISLSEPLRRAAGLESPRPVSRPSLNGFDLLLAAVREIRDASNQRVVALLIDGLEKATTGLATRVLSQLERLRSDAQVIVVVPTSVATGPSAAVLGEYHLASIGPVVASRVDESVTSEMAEQGTAFLLEIARRRLNVASFFELEALMRSSAAVSGGLVRTFLQLVHGAAVYASMHGQVAPDMEALTQAARDQTSFLLRLLKEGDADALRAAHGTSGRDIDIDRRIRFLANGLLLEYETPRGPVVQVAPLLGAAILKDQH